MIRRVVSAALAILGTAALTLFALLALVQGTIFVVSIPDVPLRILAVLVDIVLGTILLVGCVYLATHIAVRIWGFGAAEIPPLPKPDGLPQK